MDQDLIPPGWGRSLGILTELGVLLPTSTAEDRGDHLVVRTPGQPGYYWGNFLAFRESPGPGDAERWPRLFADAFGADPAIRHMAFGWDDPAGCAGLAETFAGFALEIGTVLTTEVPSPPAHPTPGLEVRPLASDADWEAATQNQIGTRGEAFELEAYTRFKRARMATYREMAEAGRGAWYGAFLDGRLVGDCGIFRVRELGRYQSVGTHPDFRRRGICATLVHGAAVQAQAAFGIRRFVIVAEPGEAGDRVYRSVGFAPTERFAGTLRAPTDEKAGPPALGRGQP